MLHRMTLDEKFLAFLDTRDPNERYDWRDTRECACGQFCRHTYGPEPFATAVSSERWGGMTVEEQRRIWHSPDGSFNDLAFNRNKEDGWTFGQLRDRFLAARR